MLFWRSNIYQIHWKSENFPSQDPSISFWFKFQWYRCFYFVAYIPYHIIYTVSIRLSSNSTCLPDHGALFSENIYSGKPHTFDVWSFVIFSLEIIEILQIFICRTGKIEIIVYSTAIIENPVLILMHIKTS